MKFDPTQLNVKVIILIAMTLGGVLLGLVSPIFGGFYWFIGLGAICFGRVAYYADDEMYPIEIVRTALSSWAIFSVAIIIPKLLTMDAVDLGLYVVLTSTILAAFALQIEAFRMKLINGIYLVDFFSYAGHYLVIATIMTVIGYLLLNVITSGTLDLGFFSETSYATVYRGGMDILTVQISAITTHVLTAYFHNAFKSTFEKISLYSN